MGEPCNYKSKVQVKVISKKQEILKILQDKKNTWVDSKLLLHVTVGGERFGARIEELRKDGYIIETRQNPDPSKKSWQYRLVVVDMNRRGGWICSGCGAIEKDRDKIVSNTISPNHATTYCVPCGKKRTFEYRS